MRYDFIHIGVYYYYYYYYCFILNLSFLSNTFSSSVPDSINYISRLDGKDDKDKRLVWVSRDKIIIHDRYQSSKS